MPTYSSSFLDFTQSGLLLPRIQPRLPFYSYNNPHLPSHLYFKLPGSKVQKYGHSCTRHNRLVGVAAMDWDSVGSFSLDDTVSSDGSVGYTFSSSEGEESDGDILLNPISDVDIPTARERFRQPDDALTVTAHELAAIGRSRRNSKMVVPLPLPVGLVCMGNLYLLLTAFCFVLMANGVELTDGLDGLAGGTAALAFIGMSIAVLPICSDLAVFGASMAGACVGFLFHNRYKASVFMGDTGALALGGGLAAMAACTGMFFPLLISCGVIVLDALSVILQVSYFKTTKRRLFRMVPLHYHLESCGVKEPVIVAGAYVVSSLLMLGAGYVALISV